MLRLTNLCLPTPIATTCIGSGRCGGGGALAYRTLVCYLRLRARKRSPCVRRLPVLGIVTALFCLRYSLRRAWRSRRLLGVALSDLEEIPAGVAGGDAVLGLILRPTRHLAAIWIFRTVLQAAQFGRCHIRARDCQDRRRQFVICHVCNSAVRGDAVG